MTALCACGCGKPARSGRSHGRFASDKCKARYHRKMARGGRGTRPSLLSVLRIAGPRGATTGELVRAGVGVRYGARLCNLRKLGYVVTSERVRDGEWRYTLISEPEELAA